MKKRELLLRLKLCDGIGIKGEYWLSQWLKTQDIENENLVSLEKKIVKALNGAGFQTQKFRANFLSTELNQRVKRNRQCQFISILDQGYPELLAESYCPPVILFYQGNLDFLRLPMVSVVGARKCTNYSIECLKKILSADVLKKYVIVSGLAAGVDGYSHQCAMAHDGKTIAVIGNGLNVNYPRKNAYIQNEIKREQLLLSEYPLDAKPLPFHFIERNRIIAGLCSKLIVIEAKERSGSLITANLALQDNRDVLAVPGSILSELSGGCNQLIKAGARPCLDENDLLNDVVI